MTKRKIQHPNIREHLRQYRRMLPWITIKELLMIVISTIPYAIAVNQLLVPHAIVGGGVTGLCEIIYFATNAYIPIWLSSAIINVLLLVIAAITVGKQYALRTIWGVMWLTIWLKLIPVGLDERLNSCALHPVGAHRGDGIAILEIPAAAERRDGIVVVLQP